MAFVAAVGDDGVIAERAEHANGRWQQLPPRTGCGGRA